LDDSLKLTPRQLRVLELAADDQCYDSIAVKLEPPTSEKTVKTQMAIIRRQFGARSRIGAVMEAVRRGVIRLE
jgi:DNA-binding NarL/FixJ family response regulator